MPDSLQPRVLQLTRLLCSWDFPDKDTGVGCHFLLQRIFLTQGSSPHLLLGRQILYHWAPRGSFLVHSKGYHCHCCPGAMVIFHSILPHFLSSFQKFCEVSSLITIEPHIQFSSVAQSCLTLCDPMDCSTPGFPVHQEFRKMSRDAQSHIMD